MNHLAKKDGPQDGAATCSKAQYDECGYDEIHVGAWVEIGGLSSDRGKGLNGLVGEVTSVGVGEAERVGVYIHEEGKTVSILPASSEITGSN